VIQTIDEDKIKEEARYDGKWVLQTNLADQPKVIALAYKELWMVEEMFRTMKSILETRPIYHKRDETIRGHVFCSFLALVLRRASIVNFQSRAPSSSPPPITIIRRAQAKGRRNLQPSTFNLRPPAFIRAICAICGSFQSINHQQSTINHLQPPQTPRAAAPRRSSTP
jgi:hypothetical protein